MEGFDQNGHMWNIYLYLDKIPKVSACNGGTVMVSVWAGAAVDKPALDGAAALEGADLDGDTLIGTESAFDLSEIATCL